MSGMDSNHREVLLTELELHKTEFSTLRDEILHTMDAEKQALNLSLVAAGAGISVLSFIDQRNVYIVLLLFPFVFHVILWEMLNAIKSLSRISSYMTTTLIPRVNEILDELGSDRREVLALGWEVHTAKVSMKPFQIMMTSLIPTRHWMPILAVAGLLAAYSIISNTNNHIPSSTELFLILLNLMLLIWAAVQNLVTVRSYSQNTQPVLPGDDLKKAKANSKIKQQSTNAKSKK